MASDSGKFYILVDNRLWLKDLVSRPTHLWQLMVTKTKAFLNQRLLELTNQETLSLQHQVQAVAPFVLQQYSSESIQEMLSDISLPISKLTNRKTRDLIMILNSKSPGYPPLQTREAERIGK